MTFFLTISASCNDLSCFFVSKERGTSFTTEFAGGTATFLTMAYILAINPDILAQSGGPCVPNTADGGETVYLHFAFLPIID